MNSTRNETLIALADSIQGHITECEIIANRLIGVCVPQKNMGERERGPKLKNLQFDLLILDQRVAILARQLDDISSIVSLSVCCDRME